MKINFVGLVGCLLVGISLVAPWVTTYSWSPFAPAGRVYTLSELHLYELQLPRFFFGWLTLVLLIAGITLGLIGSFKMQYDRIVAGVLSSFGSQLLFLLLSSVSGVVPGNYFSHSKGWFDVGFYMSLIGTLLLYLSSHVKANSRFIVSN